MAHAPHPLARRIHDGVMQLLGTALLKTEMCEQLARLGQKLGRLNPASPEAEAIRQQMAKLGAYLDQLQKAIPPGQPDACAPPRSRAGQPARPVGL